MKKDFLSRLYCSVSAEQSNPCAGKQLNELYERTLDVRSTRDALDVRLAALNVEPDDVCDEVALLVEAFEQQGFINGFCLGMILWNELNCEASS